MKKTTNSKCREFVAEKTEFKANNLKGVWVGEIYVVYSYNWFPLFVYNRGRDVWLENEEKYSVSTSKQKGQCHPHTDTVKANLTELQDLVRKHHDRLLNAA